MNYLAPAIITTSAETTNSSVTIPKCNNKCNFSFNYYNSNCKAEIFKYYIELTYDQATVPPVLFNSIQYKVDSVRIYVPSLTHYNVTGSNGNSTVADGEIVINHLPFNNNSVLPLLVCIPIKVSSSDTLASNILSNIISQLQTLNPAFETQVTLNIGTYSPYNLDAFIPTRSHYYYYQAQFPTTPTGAFKDYNIQQNIITFLEADTSVFISQNNLNWLKSKISNTNVQADVSTPYFISDHNASSSIPSDVYIECSHVGDSEEEDIYYFAKSSYFGQDAIDKFFKNNLLQIIIGIVLFMSIAYTCIKLYKV